MKRILAVLAVSIALILLFSGCVEEKDPKTLYKELLEKAKNPPNGKLTYNATYGLTALTLTEQESQPVGLSILQAVLSEPEDSNPYSISMKTELYVLNEKRKTVSTMHIMGISMTTAIFEIGDRMIACYESPLSYSGEEITCSEGLEAGLDVFGAESFGDFSDEIIEAMNITLEGEKTFANRPCHDFKITFDSEALQKIVEKQTEDGANPLLSGMGLQEATAEYEICLDKEHGFESFMNVKFTKESKLTEERMTLLSLTIELESFDPNGASESDFVLPIDFSLEGVGCKENMIDFTVSAINDIGGQLEVSIGESSYLEEPEYSQVGTATIPNMAIGDKEKVSIELSDPLENGSYGVQVCSADGKCATGNCFYYGSYTPPEPKIFCYIMDPIRDVQISVMSSDISHEAEADSQESLGRVIVKNTSGGKLSNISCVGSKAFAEEVPGCPETLETGFQMVLEPMPAEAGTYYSGWAKITHTDDEGVETTSTLNCSGTGTIEIS